MPFVKSTFSIPLENLQGEQPRSSEEKAHSFRPLCLRCGVFGSTRGSAYVEFGRTRVLAQVYGPKEDGSGDCHSGTITVLDVCVACHISVSTLGDYCVDPPSETTKDESHVTVGLLPNLNQIVCCDVRGALSLNQSSKAISFALDKALKLYPVVRKAVLAGLT
uniref:RNase_PH domain-containing protein n=1 Tax=Heterorhabditis bacteriophora TaxID=37862 RepID=A0A1I7XT08_HETBA